MTTVQWELQEKAARIRNGRMSVEVDLADGKARIEWSGGDGEPAGFIRNAVSVVLLDGATKSTADAASRESSVREIKDAFGKGAELSIVHRLGDGTELTQSWSLYDGLNYGFVRLEARGADGRMLETNRIAPISALAEEGAAGFESESSEVNSGARREAALRADSDENLGEQRGATRRADSKAISGSGTETGSAARSAGQADGEALRALLVPYDNDKWVRFESVAMPGKLESYEATAVYRNGTRNGLVLGSVTHDTWKTGIQIEGADGSAVHRLEVYGGAAGEYTRDTVPHGAVAGETVVSPTVFFGLFADYRDGMETLGRANARIAPPLAWEGTVPFGWNSWSAVGSGLSYDSYVAAADLIREVRGHGFHDGGVTYVNFDAFGSNLTAEERRRAVDHVHRNGQKAGTYWTPFTYWGKPEEAGDRVVEGTDGRYRYSDLLLRDEAGNVLPDLDGGWAIDPTHPGNLLRTERTLKQIAEDGYEYVKLDFMAHGALEGKHYRSDIRTGIQAYNEGMRQIVSLLDPRRIGRPFFIHLSIAPLFPHSYAHGRRISCDAFGELKDTEYMLNSVTYGWWMHRTLYAFNDPDHTVLYKSFNHEPTTEAEGRSRLNASLIAGTVLLMGDDYREPEARRRALAWLTDPALMAVARRGETFVPLEGDSGDRATPVFIRMEPDGGAHVAVFNYAKDRPAELTVDLARIGLDDEADWRCEDLWSKEERSVEGQLTVSLAPAESTLLKLSRAD
ncbi:alpha-galactosidase [Cohnella zeiphila]|uniref:Alpha-galactosidase n=1 Tax=Cohnella zeiphila TaxID=2761120 RepID=A0A7X0VUE2_9BACL|nr:alpha-galactosidase [Cohnella zeiphila]MBB6730162.1 alpha-galactosidase [Cohnella zeiphila]